MSDSSASSVKPFDFQSCQDEGRNFLQGFARKFFESIGGLLAVQFEIKRKKTMGLEVRVLEITMYMDTQEKAIPELKGNDSVCLFRRQEFL
jgi:hypothetical protein